jgi:hypothetical protein
MNFGNRLKPEAALLNREGVEHEPFRSPQQLEKWAPVRYRTCADDQTEWVLSEKNVELLVRGSKPAITSNLFEVSREMPAALWTVADE